MSNEALRLADEWEPRSYEVASMIRQLAERIAELEGERDQHKHTATSLLSLLADIRMACGDNGKRMQPELVEFIGSMKAERDQLRAEVERLRADAERYRVLRCYELGGAWPDGFKAPAGLLVFSGGLTQHELDKVLDDMLGHLPHPSPGSVRADYQQWRRSQTLSAVDAIAARTTHKDTP